MSCGSHGLIIPAEHGMVMKKSRRGFTEGLSIFKQKQIHNLSYNLLEKNDFKIIRVPKMVSSVIAYKMETIDTSRPLFLGDSDSCANYPSRMIEDIVSELVVFWELLWDEGYAAWDFELFVQPDGSVAMIDFDRFGVRRVKQHEQPYLEEYQFFQHACFLPQFQNLLRPEFRTQGWLSR